MSSVLDQCLTRGGPEKSFFATRTPRCMSVTLFFATTTSFFATTKVRHGHKRDSPDAPPAFFTPSPTNNADRKAFIATKPAFSASDAVRKHVPLIFLTLRKAYFAAKKTR